MDLVAGIAAIFPLVILLLYAPPDGLSVPSWRSSWAGSIPSQCISLSRCSCSCRCSNLQRSFESAHTSVRRRVCVRTRDGCGHRVRLARMAVGLERRL